ncbi:MAG: LSM domain-containing protein [Thermoproteota archaeon]
MSTDTTMELLQASLGKSIIVKLKGGTKMRGILDGYDPHLNIVLSDAEELRGNEATKLGVIIIRGDNVILISPPIEYKPREKG